MEFVQGDVRYDHYALLHAVARAQLVLHLAAQVAVTTSIARPIEDFEINARGTFNVLEAVRESGNKPLVLYSSTNKVYGGMEDLAYARMRPAGASAIFPTAFPRSGRWISTRLTDAARARPINTYTTTRASTAFRRWCFASRASTDSGSSASKTRVGWRGSPSRRCWGGPITIYGDGLQIRDLLHVNDLVAAYKAAAANPQKSGGQIFNVGGGPSRTLSLVELLAFLEKRCEKKIPVSHAEPRAGDQPVFVADIRKIERELNWRPRSIRWQAPAC